jgi:hypothetical protein
MVGIATGSGIPVGPVAPMAGYVATGGARAMPEAGPSARVAGGSAMATGTGSGTSPGTGSGTNTTNYGSADSCAPSNTSAGPSTSSAGKWTVSAPPVSGGSGGGEFSGTLKIDAPSGGTIYIGSNATISVSLSGGGSPMITSVSWSSYGAPEMYVQSSQVVPNPATLSDPSGAGIPSSPKGLTTFQQQDYQFPAATPPATSIKFAFGQTPGDEKFTATVNFTDDGVPGSATAERTVRVLEPSTPGNIYYLLSASAKNGVLIYGSYNGVKLRSGKFPDGSTSKTGDVPGIDFEYVTVPASQGTLMIEQFIQPESAVVVQGPPGANPAGYIGFMNYTGGVYTAAKFPLLDLGVRATVPWLQGSSDSPSGFLKPGYTLSINDQFKDYVMFMPATGGIWVPEANFTWQFQDVAKPNGKGGWTLSPALVGVNNYAVNHSEWPQAWTDLAYKYRSRKPT